MPCRELKSGERLNSWEKQRREEALDSAKKNYELAKQKLDRARVRRSKYDYAQEQAKGKTPIVVCVVDYCNGYGKVFGYLKAYCDKETAKRYDKRDQYSSISSTDVGTVQSQMIDDEIWAEVIGEYENDDMPYELKIHGTQCNY